MVIIFDLCLLQDSGAFYMFISATPAHEQSQPFFLATRLNFEQKSSSRNQFSPPLPCCSTKEGNSVWCHFHGFELYFYINYSLKIALDDVSRFHRILEPWVMKRETVIGKKNCHQILTEVGLRNLFVPSMREGWVAKNAKQPAPKPVDMSVNSNNLVKDGARGSDAFYGGGSRSSCGKIPWGRF
ncbi:uncharacterized protein [Pyrus communis]|uniref:uncharacterized protein isoform X2 n=1 Tax=Pyrus communis TaxID=23211 RepID=UPI0035BF3229